MFYCEKLCQSTVIGLAIIAFISYGNCAEHSTPRHYRNDDATPDPPTTPLPGVDDCPAITPADSSEELSSEQLGCQVKWPAANVSQSLIVSTPLCLDHNKQLKVKKCLPNLGWQPHAVVCNYTQKSYDLADKCPDDYVQVTNDICVLMHRKQPFMSVCDDNLLPFTIYNMTKPELESFFEYLRNYAPSEMFWLPIIQTNLNVSMQIGFTYTIDEIGLQWTMPGFYGEQVILHDNCPTCTFLDHGGCLALKPELNSDDRFNTSVINCNSNYLHSFCLFKKNEPLNRLACPDGYVAPMMPKHLHIECLAINRFDPIEVANVANTLLTKHCTRSTAFQLDSVQSTFSFERLASQLLLSPDDRCLFGITSRQVAVFESNFIEMLGRRGSGFGSFVNWDTSMGLHDFNNTTNHALSVNYLGKWFWESNSVSCIVCSVTVGLRSPSLVLRYDSVQDKLLLQLINSAFLMTRFTNNLKFMCFAKVHNQYVTNLKATQLAREMLYDIKLIGPGNYWCLGHALYSGSRVESVKIYAQGVIMSMWVEFQCQPNHCVNFQNAFRTFLYSRYVNSSLIMDPQNIRIEDVSHFNATFLSGNNFVNILYRVRLNIVNDAALRNEQNVLNLSDEMLTYYYVRQKFVLISNLQTERSEFRIRSVNSTDFCLPSSISVLSEVNWLGARIGETIESVESCFDSNGRPLQMKCVGDAHYGATWIPLSAESCYKEVFSDLTEDLQDLIENFEDAEQSEEVIESLTNLISNSSERLVRMDVFFVSRIMSRVASFLHKQQLTLYALRNLVLIYNNIMLIDELVARSSATLNSTNVLLESLEVILMYEATALRTAPEVISLGSIINNYDKGIVVNISPMLINFVIDPMLTDVSGVALLRNDTNTRVGIDVTGLTDYTVQYLYRNQSQFDLLVQCDLEVASFLPNNVLLDILATNPDAKLIFSIFYNDVLFQTFENTTFVKSDGKIIAVAVSGLEELPGIVPIYVRPEHNINDYCGYWDYDNVDGWSETGCYFMGQDPTTSIVMCGCNHLTHFAYLLKGDSSQLEGIHMQSLTGITVLGCSLSLIGIAGIYITAIQFRSWRSKTSTKYLLQLSTAIAFQMILLAFVNTASMTQFLLLTNNETWCIIIGVLLHYFVLAMFFWMLIIAYLQFIRYVIVFNHVKTPRFLLKSSVLGWTLPMVPVLLVVSIDSETYIPDLDFSASQICYPSGYSLYFGILLPIGVIVGANLVVFILVNYNLLRGTNAVCRAGDRNSKLSQLRLSIFLFFLLGLTWIFGLLSTAFAETSIVFAYLFCLTSTFQGFVMFLYFVIMDPVARNLWIYFFKRLCCSKKGNIDIRKDSSSKGSY